jgi:D-alanine-D-alanine ligase
MNVWVIMGGASAEREVSLASGRAVAQALREGGHRVLAYELRDGIAMPDASSPDAARDLPPRDPGVTWAEALLAAARALRGRAEVAFLALHGDEGEDGTVQALLEVAGFPYTGSGPAACAISMDKVLTKRVMESLGIATPSWSLIDVGAPPPAPISMPVVVKPISEGSSVGISIVERPEDWAQAIRRAAEAPGRSQGRRTQVMAEEYVPGRELTVGILRYRVLPVLEINPRAGFYDYERKYTAGESCYEVPAKVPAEVAKTAQDNALLLFRSLGCRGIARVDFRLPPEGPPMCLEINAIPGLTATSLFPKAAMELGIGFCRLLEMLCADGVARVPRPLRRLMYQERRTGNPERGGDSSPGGLSSSPQCGEKPA